MRVIEIVFIVLLFLAIISAAVLTSGLLVKTKSSSKERKNVLTVFSLLSFIIVLSFFIVITLYSEVGIPQEKYSVYYPIQNGEVYEKTWSSEKDGKFLFSVARFCLNEEGGRDIFPRVSGILKDFMNEIFSSETSVPNLFVVIDNKFVSITKEQANKILKMKLEGEKINRFLWE
jgi:hypothetical protein